MTDYKNDIEKYFKGELTPAQMNALEKKALNDPFLADALEGAQQIRPDDLYADVNLLQASLKKRISQSNVIWSWSLRIAAGLLVLAVSTYVIILFSTRQDSKNLALNKENKLEPTQQAESPGPTFDSSKVLKKETLSLQTPAREELKEDKAKAPSNSEKKLRSEPKQSLADIGVEDSQTSTAATGEAEQSSPKSDEAIEPIVPEEKIVQADPQDARVRSRVELADEKEKKSDDTEKDSEVERVSERRKSAAGAPAKTQSFSDKIHRRVIRGKVTFSDDGTGLPGVNVIIKGTNEGTVTDAAGNYQIPVDDSPQSLTFSFIGFTSKEIETSSDELNVQLDTDVSELSEVVVVGYGSATDAYKLSNDPPVTELATPAGGRKVFKQYLEENLRYPQQALKNQVEGKVTIQFTIGTSGQLSDFRVIRGIGFGCDEEVIRLIKQGPKWSPTKKDEEPVRDRAKVRMRFALPKK